MSVKNTPDGESPAPQAPEESAWTVDDPAHVASDVVAGPDAAGEPEAVTIVETAAGESAAPDDEPEGSDVTNRLAAGSSESAESEGIQVPAATAHDIEPGPDVEPGSDVPAAPDSDVEVEGVATGEQTPDPGDRPESEPVVEPEPEPEDEDEPGPVTGSEQEPGTEPDPGLQAEPSVACETGAPGAPSVETTPVPERPQAPAGAPSVPATGWAAVRAALRPHRATRGQTLAGVLCAILGFGLVVQVHQTNVSGLASLKPADLVQVLARLTGESARLEEEAQSLQEARERLADGDLSRAAAEESARRRMEVLAVLAGTVPARGPGIMMSVTDPKGRVGAAEILDAVQELRDAGAEVMQFEGPGTRVRVVAGTSFVDADGGIRCGDVLVKAPYTLTVIGDPDTLTAALGIPGGVDDVLKGRGADVTITGKQDLRVDALAPPVHYRYAQPTRGEADDGFSSGAER